MQAHAGIQLSAVGNERAFAAMPDGGKDIVLLVHQAIK
jgi:hypothetical protein